MFIMGNPANFEGAGLKPEEIVEKGHPHNILGIIHRGGFIVPLLLAVNITVIIVSIERFITLSVAAGKGNASAFVHQMQSLLAKNDLDGAIKSCDVQKGSLANVIKSGLTRYQIVKSNESLNRDEKKAAIEKELEEATSLELPMLSRNLVIVSTMASIGTLVGLIGTVFGMIRAFAALANAGAPDTAALATGISEALVNTAFGIIGSTLAIISYNYFSNRIDGMTHAMDEAGYSIVSNFQANHS
jgi:biopolymer transport protein ExbB